MSSDYAKKMQNLTREVYSFELQADASKRKIEKLSSEIAKMQSKLRQGGLDAGTTTVYNRDISENSTILDDEKKRYENLTGLTKQARTELQNMQAEYVRYSGSTNATADNVKNMTDALAGMIEEMKKVPTVGIICISYVEICYKGAKLRCDIPSQFPFSIKNLEDVEMYFMGYDKLGAPLFDFCVKHIEGKVKRVSPNTVEICQSDGSVMLRSYTSACKHFRGLLDANVGVNLPLNLRPYRVCLDKQLMRKRCKNFFSEVGEYFSCQIIGVTDKVSYVKIQLVS